jgi:hypothetical protein
MDVPRFAGDPKAGVLLDESFEWPVPSDPSRTSTVRVKLTLLPESWRLKKGWGNRNYSPTRERRIHENEGFSILRSKREIFYDVSRNFYGTAVENIDRWHGIEILFEPDLDECFRVRNVKKGAEPVDNLRSKLTGLLQPAIEVARKHIRNTYKETDVNEKLALGIHEEAENIGADVEKVSPKSRSGQENSPDEREEKLRRAAEAAAESAAKGAEDGLSEAQVEAIKDRLKKMPLSIIDHQWPGREFIEIDHLGANVVIKLNNRHPFFTDIYGPVLKAAGVLAESPTERTDASLSEDELREVARAVHTGLDLMIMAYAKAESMDKDASEKYAELRTYWGLFLSKYIEQKRSSQ